MIFLSVCVFVCVCVCFPGILNNQTLTRRSTNPPGDPREYHGVYPGGGLGPGGPLGHLAGTPVKAHLWGFFALVFL